MLKSAEIAPSHPSQSRTPLAVTVPWELWMQAGPRHGAEHRVRRLGSPRPVMQGGAVDLTLGGLNLPLCPIMCTSRETQDPRHRCCNCPLPAIAR